MKKLKVGILGNTKLSHFILEKLNKNKNRFEVFKHNAWDQEFIDIGALDILWVCKLFKSNKQLKKNIISLIVEYNPTICFISNSVKPFTTLELQNKIKELGLKTHLIYTDSSCPEVLLDYQRYIHAFNLLIGWDLKGSLLLAKTHFSELQIPIRSIKGSFNLEISKLLINYNYLLYNYCEQQRKRIFRKYEYKNKDIDRNVFEDIMFEVNEGLIEIQKPSLILPTINQDIKIGNKECLKFLPNSLRFRFLIYSDKKTNELKNRIKNVFRLMWLKVKGRINIIKRKFQHAKLSNSLRSKSRKKTL